MKVHLHILAPFLVSAALIMSCKESTTGPANHDRTYILRTLDSLELTFLQVGCGYNGFPPPNQYAYIFAELRVHNTSSASTADSVFLDHGRFFLASVDSNLFDFTMTNIWWYGDTLLSARLDPLATDTVWFNYAFSPSLAPCDDSVYFQLVITNSYADSLTLRSPVVLFECSY
jgi:hypothetical protein